MSVPRVFEAAGVLALLLAVLFAGACSPPEEGEGTVPGRSLTFVDRRAECGVDFVHQTGAGGSKWLPEINGGCATLLDYDGDGRLDLFLGNGAPLPGCDPATLDFRDRLYRNRSAGGSLSFEDVTDATSATEPGYTFHASAPDLDGDGDPELYLSNLEHNVLLENREARFEDRTAAWNLDCTRWTTASAFADFDHDGDLDVYLSNYVVLPPDPPRCGPLSRGPQYLSYCSPSEFAGARDAYLENEGGHFVDRTEEAGVQDSESTGLMALLGDVDEDGWLDVFVANDGRPNFLWRNREGESFEDVAYAAGVAVADNGRSEASMGCDFGDVDGDGDQDLVIANLAMETNTLYVAEPGALFSDQSLRSGIGAPSLPYVGFGCELFDADLDGDQDLMVANGHILDNVELFEPTQSFRQPPLFYRGDGKGRFEECGASLGAYFRERWVGRGLCTGDLDGDGDDDVVVAHNHAAPAVLENVGPPLHHWLGVSLEGRGQNRSALGAKLLLRGARPQSALVRGTSSYSAFQDLRVRFGLGEDSAPVTLVVQWPDGSTSEHPGLEVDRYHRLVEPAR